VGGVADLGERNPEPPACGEAQAGLLCEVGVYTIFYFNIFFNSSDVFSILCFPMTMVSRESRQIVGFDAARDKLPKRIQAIVDGDPKARKYCAYGYLGTLT
jgi:hypothetical protein